jgi:hypothetical protein
MTFNGRADPKCLRREPGDIIGLHTLYQGAFETILERVTVYQLTDWGFFVLRDTGELQGLLNIDKNGYVPHWGKMGWIAPLDLTPSDPKIPV